MLTRAELQVIRERCNLANRVPWGISSGGSRIEIRTFVVDPPINGSQPIDPCEVSVRFIMQSKKDIPLLLDYVDQLEATIMDQGRALMELHGEIAGMKNGGVVK